MNEFNPDIHFDFDEDAEEYFSYYILGERPVRLTVWNDAPILAETINFETKKFEIDNTFIMAIIDSLDAEKVSEADFINQCLKFGVKPERKD